MLDIQYPWTGDRDPYSPQDPGEQRLRTCMSPYLIIIEHAIYRRLPEQVAATFHAKVNAALGTGKDLRGTACAFLRRQLSDGHNDGIASFGWTAESRAAAQEVATHLEYVPWVGDRNAEPRPEWVLMVCAVAMAYNGIFQAFDAVVRDRNLDRVAEPTEADIPSIAVYEAAYHAITVWTPDSAIRHMAANFIRNIAEAPPVDAFIPYRSWWFQDSEVILPHDIRAARPVTAAGWASSQGSFYLDEQTAREAGSTRAYCLDCAAVIFKTYDQLCDDCRTKRQIAVYAKLPREKTDECVYAQARDTYYNDVQSAYESLEPGESLADMRLMVCHPHMADALDSSRWFDGLGPDIDVPQALEDAVDALNLVIRGGKTKDQAGNIIEVPPLGPLCWYPGQAAADISDFPSGPIAEEACPST